MAESGLIGASLVAFANRSDYAAARILRRAVQIPSASFTMYDKGGTGTLTGFSKRFFGFI